MARIASRNFTKHCFLATWIFDIRNLDYFEPAGQTVDNLRGENHGFILDTGTFKDIRDLLKSVFIPALPKGSRARQIAEGANDPVNADSYLRGKAEFDGAAAALLLVPNSSEDGTIRFRDANQDQLTPAGMVVAQPQLHVVACQKCAPCPWPCRSVEYRPRIRPNTNTWSIPVSRTPASVRRSIC
jgi:hypothetical protein